MLNLQFTLDPNFCTAFLTLACRTRAPRSFIRFDITANTESKPLNAAMVDGGAFGALGVSAALAERSFTLFLIADASASPTQAPLPPSPSPAESPASTCSPAGHHFN
ncbi:hypothetical protein AOLI_G00283210 [Acnodon oligacanthus]